VARYAELFAYDEQSETFSLEKPALAFSRHSGATRKRRTRKSGDYRREIPGSRYARPGMTVVEAFQGRRSASPARAYPAGSNVSARAIAQLAEAHIAVPSISSPRKRRIELCECLHSVVETRCEEMDRPQLPRMLQPCGREQLRKACKVA